jgi:glutaryl-CoA dehydrogenase
MYKQLDYMHFNDLLNEEEILIQDTVRKFVTKEYMPTVADNFQEAHFDKSIIPQLGELGLLGANLPEKYGCAELSAVSYGIINQELERGDSGLRSFASVQSALVMYPIFAFGSEEQRMKWLPELATGKKIGCFGLTEPDHGSDPQSMITNAVEKKDHYLLNGAKMWITNGSMSDIAIVWAKLDGDIRGFIVETGLEGYTRPLIKDKHSLRASITSELVFDNVKLPKDSILPNVLGIKGPLSCLTQARYGISWGVIGAAQACFDEALQYTKERTQFGKPIAQFQLTQDKLAIMATEITKAQFMTYQLGQLKDNGKLKPAHVSMCKRNNAQMALDIARTCRGMLGANGISSEYQTMRHMCNLESVYTYEGTHEIHTLIVGQTLTGLAAYK